MSQFSQKYYKLNYKHNDSLRNKKEDIIWQFWFRWGLFEYAVIILLFLILFCLCSMKNSFIPTSPYVTKSQNIVQTVHIKQAEKIKDIKPKSNENYSEKILPDSILPLRTTLNSQEVYGPITIEDYLYFIDATDTVYPDFTNKTSSCTKPECPLKAGTNKIFLSAYTKWVSKQSQKNLQLLQSNSMYYLTKQQK